MIEVGTRMEDDGYPRDEPRSCKYMAQRVISKK